MKRVITGLDIGTTKICAAVAEASQSGIVEIRGIGETDARGVNKGFVSNLDKLVDSVSRAVHAAEEKSGLTSYRVVTNISGASVKGVLTHGSMLISRRGREITSRDVAKIIETTKNMSLTLEKKFLYTCPHEFIVDDNEGVENPCGLFGAKLTSRLYAITALRSHIQNIAKAVGYAGYEPIDIIPAAIADAATLLTDKEKAAGAILIDLGGGVTEVSIFRGGIIRFFDSINVGGMDMTAGLSAGLKIPFDEAEAIKKKYASVANEDLARDAENIFEMTGRQVTVSSSTMNGLLKDRLDEISHILRERLKASEFYESSIPSLIVTGGCALLNGALETLEAFFNIPTRLGSVKGLKCSDPAALINPSYSAAVSLAKYGIDKHAKPRPAHFKGESFLINTFYRFRELLDEYF